MKAGPLSDPKTSGTPYWDMISSSNALATTWAVSRFVGKASTQPDKISTNTSKYLYPYFPGFTSVKSTSQLRPGPLPHTLVPVCRGPFLLGLIAWHPTHRSTISWIWTACCWSLRRVDSRTVSNFLFPKWVAWCRLERRNSPSFAGSISLPSGSRCHPC